MLALGLIAFVVVALALASAGGVGGIVAVAVVEAAAVTLLYSWCVTPASRPAAPEDQPEVPRG
jgi:hypothetical protein